MCECESITSPQSFTVKCGKDPKTYRDVFSLQMHKKYSYHTSTELQLSQSANARTNLHANIFGNVHVELGGQRV